MANEKRPAASSGNINLYNKKIMFSQIVKLFYELSRQHKLVRSFKYDRPSKGLGVGDEMMPHVFLEDPIYAAETNLTNGVVPVTVNFDIMITPQMLNNFSVYPTTEAGQSLCYSIGLNYIAKIREMINHGDDFIKGVAGWSVIGLKHYYDNDCDGVRFSLVLTVKNLINFCDTEAHFDPDKEFKHDEPLESFKTDKASGCAVFNDKKLPNFRT